jgi:uncharacterized lipoprotein YehR (DUF1307 family)
MKKTNFRVLLVFALVMGLVFVACDTGTGGGTGNGPGGGTGSTLTINNCPSYARVAIYANNTPTTLLQLQQMATEQIAVGMESISPFTLLNIEGTAFTRTGKYLVLVTGSANSIYFKGDVSFNNGSATVEFNSMIPHTSLPSGF